MSDIAKGRVEFLQSNIIDSMDECYKRMNRFTWISIFSKLLKDNTIREQLRARGIHVREDDYR